MPQRLQANILQIEERVAHAENDMVSPRDFRTKPAGTADARLLIDDPWITLYCLDDRNRHGLFVETPPGCDLRAYPFYYQAQFQNAVRLFAAPYDLMHQLAAQAGDRFQNLILTYSVGRCGSTLLSQAFRRVDTVIDLSEPDVYTQITALRPKDGSRDAELRHLLQTCTRLLFRTSGPENTLAIKFRSFSIEIADLMHEVYPQAKILFLYRNAETWARSQARAFNVFGESAKAPYGKTLEENPEFFQRAMPLLSQYLRRFVRARLRPRDVLAVAALKVAGRLPGLRGRVPTPAQYLGPLVRSYPRAKFVALQWLSVMDRYQELSRRGVPMLAVRYESIESSPRRVLEGIFAYCGLPADRLTDAETAFARDSQQGSSLARDRLAGKGSGEPTEEQLLQLREVLLEHPTVRQPEFAASNTLAV